MNLRTWYRLSWLSGPVLSRRHAAVFAASRVLLGVSVGVTAAKLPPYVFGGLMFLMVVWTLDSVVRPLLGRCQVCGVRRGSLLVEWRQWPWWRLVPANGVYICSEHFLTWLRMRARDNR